MTDPTQVPKASHQNGEQDASGVPLLHSGSVYTEYQEAPQAHAEEEAQEDAEGDPLAASRRQVAR